MKAIVILAVCVCCAFALSVGLSTMTGSKAGLQSADKKKAIVVVSFGTTYDDARKACIESVENKIRDSFPDYAVRRAFTSKIVMKRLAERDNIDVDSLEQALDKLQQEGFTEVIIQTTHLTPGEEYDNKVVAVVQNYAGAFEKLAIGRPALVFSGKNGTPDDFAIAVDALKNQLPLSPAPDEAVVFMGHGSPHQHNPAYQALQERLDAGGLSAIVGVVEETDTPNFADVQKRLQEQGIKRVILMPLMLVAGDHANNDMAGDDKDSWKSQLIAQGYQVDTYLHGLGENAVFQDIYVQHVRDAILGLYPQPINQ